MLFGGDIGLFCHARLRSLHLMGLECRHVGFFCRDVGLFCGNTELFLGDIHARETRCLCLLGGLYIHTHAHIYECT